MIMSRYSKPNPEPSTENMEIETKKIGGLTVLSPRGRMVIGDPVETFEEAVVDLVDRGERFMVIDLAKVTRIDSSGVGSLVSALRNCRDEGGELKLAEPSDHLRKVIEMMGLEQVFQIHPTVEAAIASMRG